MFAFIDLILLTGLLALLLYSFITLGVFSISPIGLNYALLVTGIILVCIWVLFRFLFEHFDCCNRNHNYNYNYNVITDDDDDDDEYRYAYYRFDNYTVTNGLPFRCMA